MVEYVGNRQRGTKCVATTVNKCEKLLLFSVTAIQWESISENCSDQFNL